MIQINDLRDDPDAVREKMLIQNALDFISHISILNANPTKVGDYTKRYGNKFNVKELKAEHFNKSWKNDRLIRR